MAEFDLVCKNCRGELARDPRGGLSHTGRGYYARYCSEAELDEEDFAERRRSAPGEQESLFDMGDGDAKND